MITRVFTVLFLVAICSGLSAGLQTPMSRLAGVVLDVNEARIVGATITIENAQMKKIGRSDDEGRFEVELPEGAYQITVEQPGFKKYRLPSFELTTPSVVNIRMEVQPPKMPQKIH